MDTGKEDQNPVSEVRPLLEKQWVRQVREKSDRSAFKKIFLAYYKRLHGFAITYLGSMERAEDVVQSVFLNIWAQRESWDPPGKLRSYLFNAVKNEALNVVRHQKVVDDTEDDVARKFRELKESKLTSDDVEVEELRRDIEEGLEKLPPRCRQIFVLNRRSGLTYAEIAEVLDISIGTVNTQMGRALKRLRNHLSDYLSFATFLGLSELLKKMFIFETILFLFLV
ncbi:RNA polymerase sigma-70 factor [Aliifodinibius sp. S!AR15-10]|uniref:RNA polymerase sigma-70 factor n=1 Tax=Aliifodinibius sp. S!AR15-10 TaxID=2950437 RepID=UPI0028635002|nr:RNA polymerase sigma-70 factor [Aliifodinibius sp. S!AR15-10]MDR8390915.1 RNA polymerase sigma-70 factor [Aliifodinibius sp. S!AR15-10]